MIFQIVIGVIVVLIIIALLIVGILNFSKSWGKWLTAALIGIILIIGGIFLYRYFKKKSLKEKYVSNNLNNQLVLIDPRESNVFLMSENSMNMFNLRDYLQKNLVETVFLFTSEYDKIMNTIDRFNVYIPSTVILNTDDTRLFKFQRALGKAGKIGVPYEFMINKKKIIIKASKNILLFSRYYTNLNHYKCFQIYTKIKNEKCLPNKQSIKVVVGSSEYVNETIIGYLLNKIFFGSYWFGPEYYFVNGYLNNTSDLGHSVFQIGYFQNPSEKIGYNVMELCDSTLDDLLSNITESTSAFNKIVFIYEGRRYTALDNRDKIFFLILQQINSILLILKNKYSFNHGDLKGGNMFYRIDDQYLNVDYPIDAYNYISTNNSFYKCRTNLRVKIADYGKASITFNEIHYYCNDTKLNANKLSQYIVDPQQVSIDSYTNEDEGKYLFDSALPKVGLEMSLRHLACPYFLSADYYLLLTSLSLTSPFFFDFIVKNGIYNRLGVSFDLQSKRPASIVSAFQKLKGQYLKCNIMEEINIVSIDNLTQQ